MFPGIQLENQVRKLCEGNNYVDCPIYLIGQSFPRDNLSPLPASTCTTRVRLEYWFISCSGGKGLSVWFAGMMFVLNRVQLTEKKQT